MLPALETVRDSWRQVVEKKHQYRRGYTWTNQEVLQAQLLLEQSLRPEVELEDIRSRQDADIQAEKVIRLDRWRQGNAPPRLAERIWRLFLAFLELTDMQLWKGSIEMPRARICCFRSI